MTSFSVANVIMRDKRVIFFYIISRVILQNRIVMQALATLRGFAERRFEDQNYLTTLLAAGYKENLLAQWLLMKMSANWTR